MRFPLQGEKKKKQKLNAKANSFQEYKPYLMANAWALAWCLTRDFRGFIHVQELGFSGFFKMLSHRLDYRV